MADFIQMNSNSWTLVKGGVSLPYGSLAAYTKTGFVVPVGHPEGIVFAGPVINLQGGDNTNGQDGDDVAVNIPSNFGNISFFAADLTKKLDVKIENLNQQVYISLPNTLHLTPGSDRMPIGMLTSIRKNFYTDPTRDSNEIVYGIDTNKIPALYR